MHDEKAGKALGPWRALEKRPAHPGPVRVLVELGRGRVPRRGQECLKVDMRINARVDEEHPLRPPMRAQAREPVAHAPGRGDADDCQKLLRAARRHFEILKLADGRGATVAKPVRERVERDIPRRAYVERQPHHHLVIAHQPYRFLSADLRTSGDREIDCAEAVWTAVDEVAEKDENASPASARLAGGLVEKGAQKIGAAMNVADCKNLDVGRDSPWQDER